MDDTKKLEALQAPFDPEDIEWRIQQSGKHDNRIWARVLAYVDNRAIMDRLDQVLGPANWKNEFRRDSDKAVMCGISIRVGDEWVTKWDGAEETAFEAVKGGLSSAMKRAAVQWGIGRYLYSVGESYAEISEKGSHRGTVKDRAGVEERFKWNPPTLPEWALPKAAPSKHGEALSTIRTLGRRLADDYTTNVEGKPVELKGWIRQNWPRLQKDPELATEIAALIKGAE
jgi:hypothetical protein